VRLSEIAGDKWSPHKEGQARHESGVERGNASHAMGGRMIHAEPCTRDPTPLPACLPPSVSSPRQTSFRSVRSFVRRSQRQEMLLASSFRMIRDLMQFWEGERRGRRLRRRQKAEGRRQKAEGSRLHSTQTRYIAGKDCDASVLIFKSHMVRV